MTDEEKYTMLDIDQTKWWVNHLFNVAKEQAVNIRNIADGEEIQSAQDRIIKALELVEEFENAQIITGGRLNERTCAYKCGLEDGYKEICEDLKGSRMKKSKDVNIYSAEQMFEYLVEQAILDVSIKNPIAWALYQTWKWADKNEEVKNEGGN